jgi:flagellin-like protein
VCGNERGITGLETAIVLTAFVVVGAAFAFTVITTGLFSSESAKDSAQKGVAQAKASLAPKGAVVLTEALSGGAHDGLADAAVLTDTTASFITEGAVVGDTIRNTTDGSSSIITALTATTITGVLAGGTDNDWDIADAYEVDLDQVATVKFKATLGAGADALSLSSATTLVTYSDANNQVTSTYAATFPTPLVDPAYWNSSWAIAGTSGPGLDVGEVVEFTINVKNLATDLLANQDFKIEVIPQTGAVLTVTRTTPLEIASVMDLN